MYTVLQRVKNISAVCASRNYRVVQKNCT